MNRDDVIQIIESGFEISTVQFKVFLKSKCYKAPTNFIIPTKAFHTSKRVVIDIFENDTIKAINISL
jgi:hypothetical protein